MKGSVKADPFVFTREAHLYASLGFLQVPDGTREVRSYATQNPLEVPAGEPVRCVFM